MIGLHIIGHNIPEYRQLLTVQQPPCVLYLDPPDTVPYHAPITIGRLHYDPEVQDALLGDPVEGGRKVARDCIASAGRNGIQIWQGLNETDVSNEESVAKLNAFERARVEALEAAGLIAGVYAFSVGWPKEDVDTNQLITDWYKPLMDWLPPQHYVIWHQYWGPDGPLAPDSYDPTGPSKVDRQRYWPWPHRILITECGIDITGKEDNGWKARCPPGMNLEEWAVIYDQQLRKFGALVSKDRRVVGKAVFMFGQGGWSPTFGIETHWRQFKCLVTDPPALPPTPGSMIRVQMADDGIIHMSVEDYLRGVVPAEVPALWPMEALKAQAVAARSYAMVAINDPRHGPDADICTTSHCQNYRPGRIHERSDQAVEMTKGQVITYQGQLANAYYSANCGGQTLGNETGFGGDPLPHLRPVDCINPGPKNGHGVGMCQWGAHDMAEAGDDYVTILKHYYTGIQLSNEGDIPPPEPPPGGEDMIDPRLSAYTVGSDGKVIGVKMETMDAPTFISKWNEFQLKPGDPYFKLVHAQFLDENQAQGNTGIHISIQDENGGSMPAQVWYGYPTDRMSAANWVGAFDNGGQGAGDVFSYPSGQGEIAQGEGNFAPESPDDLGPYLVAVYTDPGCGSVASECAYGFGLPHNRHVAYALTFRIERWQQETPIPPEPTPPGPVPPVPVPPTGGGACVGSYAILSASILFSVEKLTAKQYLEVVRMAIGDV